MFNSNFFQARHFTARMFKQADIVIVGVYAIYEAIVYSQVTPSAKVEMNATPLADVETNATPLAEVNSS